MEYSHFSGIHCSKTWYLQYLILLLFRTFLLHRSASCYNLHLCFYILDVDYKLVVPALNNNIDNVTYKKKSDKFVLTLKKATVTGWFDLKKK